MQYTRVKVLTMSSVVVSTSKQYSVWTVEAFVLKLYELTY